MLTRALLPIGVDRLVLEVPNLVEHFDRVDSYAGAKQRERFVRRRRRRIDLQFAA